MTQESDRPDEPADQTSPDMATDKTSQTGADTSDATPGPALPILRLGPDMARKDSAETDAGTIEDAEPAPPAPEETSPDPANDSDDAASEISQEDHAGRGTDLLAEPDTPEDQLGDPSPDTLPDDAPEATPSQEVTPEETQEAEETGEPEETQKPVATGADLWAVSSEESLAEETPEPSAEDADAIPPPVPPPALRPRPACAAALFGKLPARGDFIARNMPRAVQRPFEDWLIPLVQEARNELGPQWNTIWRGAGPWRFWIGADVLGGSWQRDLRKPAHEQSGTGGAMTGVLLPSADRHGRDFPLVLLLADPLARLMPPPVTVSPDRGWYDLCDELLYAARGGAEIGAVEAALDQLPGPLLPEGAEDMAALLDQRALWAQGTETLADGTSQIWPDIAQADHHLAANHRSYWWQAPRAGAAQRVLALAGLPDAGSFAFMLSQGHPEAPPADDTATL